MTKEQALWLLKNEPVKVGHWVGFRDLTDLHNEWLKDFLFRRDDQTLLAHRGSYKTTDLSVFMALNCVCFPNLTSIFFRKTDNDVGEVISQARNILVSDPVQVIVNAIYGMDLKLLNSGNADIQTNLTTNIKGAKQVTGLGIGTSITGKHADIVVTDDIVNVKDRTSRAEREATKKAYMELQNVKNRGGRFINTGTPWHKDDAISTMPNVKRYDCYQTGLIAPDQLKALRDSMTDSLFAANYELRHISESDVIFRDPKYTRDSTLIYDGVAHIDAAYGGSDYTAFTVMKEQPDGSLVAFGKLWQKHVDDCLDEIAALHERYRVGSISCETNGDKGYLAKDLKARGFAVRKYAEHMNKFLKISTHLRQEWSSMLWLDDTDPDYMVQILDYNEHAEHDDAPDSAACLARDIRKRPRMHRVSGGI